MLTDAKFYLESRNFIDDVNFTKNDPCIFVVYPPGASGDLLISIIDKHYIKTGCEYYGISSDTGKVHFYTTDYETIDLEKDPADLFNEQWFNNLAEKLGQRNLNYSLLDQVIFGCHQHRLADIKNIIATFSQSKVINIYPETTLEKSIIEFQAYKKILGGNGIINLDNNTVIDQELISSPQVLNIPFNSLFGEEKFEHTYSRIVDFLGLNGKLIRYDYIEYYLKQQDPVVAHALSCL